MRLLFVIFYWAIGIFGSHYASATMRSLTPMEQATTCYPSSPMLYSDACGGVPYMGGYPQSGLYHLQSQDSFSDISVLMNALQGQNGMYVDLMAGLNLNPTMLWQNSNVTGQLPVLSNVRPIVK